MKSIFELENEIDIQKEFEKLVDVFVKLKCVKNSKGKLISIMDYLNEKVFRTWKYRHTMESIYEYLEFIGVTFKVLFFIDWITEDAFLRFLEFTYNMLYMCKDEIPIEKGKGNVALAIRNMETILNELNYEETEVDDKIIWVKRATDVDSIKKYVNDNIANILLEYNDIGIEKDIDAKRQILKQIDLYLEEFVNVKNHDKELDQTIGMIINKMGVNHPIKEEPYLSLSEDELLMWYDKCFELMLHAIRWERVKDIKEERKKLLNNK